ncbi:lysis protein, partial [Escherichia coli]
YFKIKEDRRKAARGD